MAEARIVIEPGTRVPVLDLMRLLGALAVVMIHVSALPAAAVDPANATWWTANVLNAGSRWGDALIIMTAGALLLARPSERQAAAFIKGRVLRLLPAVLFWTLFYWALRGYSAELPPPAELLIELLRGTPYYHLWFLYMMLGMYLAMPLLRALLAFPDRGLHYYLLGLCAVLTAVEGLSRVLLDMSHASFLALFPLYLVYLLGGYLLFRDRPRFPALLLVSVGVLSIVLQALGVALLYPSVGEAVFKLMYTNRGPLVMVLTFSLFLLMLDCLGHNPSWLQVWHRCGGQALARVSLGIYALHPFWIDLFARNAIGPLYQGGSPAAWTVPLTALLVFAFSALSAWLLGQVPGLRRVVV